MKELSLALCEILAREQTLLQWTLSSGNSVCGILWGAKNIHTLATSKTKYGVTMFAPKSNFCKSFFRESFVHVVLLCY